MPERTKPTILVQLDTDPQPSVFDARGGGRRGRRPPVPPRRGHAGERPRPGLRGPVHPGPGRPAPHGDLRRRLGRGGRRGGPGGGEEDLLRPVPGLGPVRRQRLEHHRRRRRAGGACRARAARSRACRAAVLAATGPVGQRVARLLGRLGAIGRRRLARPRPRRARSPSAPRRPPAARSPRSPPTDPTTWPRARRRVGRRRRGRRGRARSCPRRVWQGLPELKVADRPQRRPARWDRGGRGDRQGRPSATASAPGGRWASAAPR